MIPKIHRLCLLMAVAAFSSHVGMAASQDDQGPRVPNTRMGRPVATNESAAVAVNLRMASSRTNASVSLPPLPEGVSDLKFEEFFKLPVGAFGLEMTDKIKDLDGKRVRIVGYMVHEEIENEGGDEGASGIVPERVMLAPTPVTVSFSHYGLCDDLPPQTIYVTMAEQRQLPIPYQRGPLLVTGTLSVGNRAERDGRISAVRLKLDPLPLAMPIAAKREPSQAAKNLSPGNGPSDQNIPKVE